MTALLCTPACARYVSTDALKVSAANVNLVRECSAAGHVVVERHVDERYRGDKLFERAQQRQVEATPNCLGI